MEAVHNDMQNMTRPIWFALHIGENLFFSFIPAGKQLFGFQKKFYFGPSTLYISKLGG